MALERCYGPRGFSIYRLLATPLRKLPLRSPKLKKITLTVHGAQHNLRIVQLSDLHIGEYITHGFLQKLIGRINRLAPDIVLLSGDILTNTSQKSLDLFALLGRMDTKYGIYAVLGNRELECFSPKEYGALCAARNIRLLCEESIKIKNLHLFGISDCGQFLNSSHQGSYDLILTHQPKSMHALERFDIKSRLFICGHTHGGQCNPFGKKMLQSQNQPYFSGLYEEEQRLIYVNSGVGCTYLPLRFLSRSEIACFEI